MLLLSNRPQSGFREALNRMSEREENMQLLDNLRNVERNLHDIYKLPAMIQIGEQMDTALSQIQDAQRLVCMRIAEQPTPTVPPRRT